MEPISFLTGLTIGLHMATLHIPMRENQANFNPGIYVESTQTGATFGLYRNTLRRTSFYLGETFDVFRVVNAQVSMTLGGITGYRRHDTSCVELGPGYYLPPGAPVDVAHMYYMSSPSRYCVEEGASKTYVAPLVTLSVKLPEVVKGVTPRITMLPQMRAGGSSAVHLSLEHAF
jgi:hypothetical protein